MIVRLTFGGKDFKADFGSPLDISLPIHNGNKNPNCYWADPVCFETISTHSFTGSVREGGSVNYQKLIITPHGNGTHTECYGHISSDPDATVNNNLKNFHFVAELITVFPEKMKGDDVILLKNIQSKIRYSNTEAIIVRTLPNEKSKTTRQYSGTNPPYFDEAATTYLMERGIHHILTDLPSIDREVDGGRLLAHKAFWQFPQNIRHHATITELVFVPDSIPDGLYLLNLQITSLEMDASPSKPVLYKLEEVL